MQHHEFDKSQQFSYDMEGKEEATSNAYCALTLCGVI